MEQTLYEYMRPALPLPQDPEIVPETDLRFLEIADRVRTPPHTSDP